jgi:hypothetical protein
MSMPETLQPKKDKPAKSPYEIVKDLLTPADKKLLELKINTIWDNRNKILSDQKAGIYFYQMKDTKNRMAAGKLILMN